MFFLNLTAGEFFALLGSLGGIVTLLYLLDRAKRKKVVSTLRFWTEARFPKEQRSRRHMRDPWSLVLQLISLVLLLLAIARMEWGFRRHFRDHVLLIDTSAWSRERSAEGPLLGREKELARTYVAALPSDDRVMVVAADSLTAPLTSFTSDRASIARAIGELESGFSSLNIGQALSFATQAQDWSRGRPGEIVYVGPGRVAEPELRAASIPNLRVLTVPVMREHCGIRRIGVKRSPSDPNGWQALASVKNYGSQQKTVTVRARFGGTALMPRSLLLRPGEESALEYDFVTSTEGELNVQLANSDTLLPDSTASLWLPANGTLNVTVFTDRPEVFESLLGLNHRLRSTFRRASSYSPNPRADLVILDGVAPGTPPQVPSLWIDPPKDTSPLPVSAVIDDAVLSHWNADAPASAGLHSRELHLARAEVFETFQGDVPVASLEQGPAVVLRPATDTHRALAIIGFDPFSGDLKYELTTPLLFTNLVRWLAPDAFRDIELSARSVGSVSLKLSAKESAAHIQIRDSHGIAVPFTVRNGIVQLFASRPGVVHVLTDNRDRVLSLTLPQIAEYDWKPSGQFATGLPRTEASPVSAIDLWKWLAFLGGAGLLLEWILFGRQLVRNWTLPRRVARSRPERNGEIERELVSK